MLNSLLRSTAGIIDRVLSVVAEAISLLRFGWFVAIIAAGFIYWKFVLPPAQPTSPQIGAGQYLPPHAGSSTGPAASSPAAVSLPMPAPRTIPPTMLPARPTPIPPTDFATVPDSLQDTHAPPRVIPQALMPTRSEPLPMQDPAVVPWREPTRERPAAAR